MRIAHQYRFLLILLLAILVAVPSSSAQQDSDQQQTNQQPDAQQQPPVTPAADSPSQASSASSSSVVLIMDNSKAASGYQSTLKRAAESIAKQFGSEHEVALMTAAEKPALTQDFTADSALLASAIRKLHTGGKLALYEALYSAVQHVRNNAVNERTAIIAFVSDLDRGGQPAPGWEQAMRSTPAVPIYIVAVRAGNWQTLELAQRVAVLSGGAVYAPTKSSDMPKIANSIASRLGGSSEAPKQADANAPLRPLTQYSSLVVREIPVAEGNGTAEIGGGENVLLQRILVERLQRSKLFKDVWVGSAIDEPTIPQAKGDAPQTTGTELEMLPMIVGFRRGNRAMRQTIPFFGGGSKMRVQIILRDRETKQPIASFTEEGSHSSGLMGGSDEKVQAQAMLEVANHIVDTMRRMKRKR